MPSPSLPYRLILILGCLLALLACKHEPVRPGPDGGNPGDSTGNPADTTGNHQNPGDTTATGDVCSPDTVYFAQDVLPLLISNCALSGCHDDQSAQDGVVLTSYASVMSTADVRPNRPGNSDLYEVLVEDDADKRMPPPPRDPLSTEQIAMIATWINQGAQDLSCDPFAGGCDTVNVTYSGTIRAILDQRCMGCHNDQGASGGVILETHAEVSALALDGTLYGALSWTSGYTSMPPSGSQLPQCQLDQIKAWVDAGAPNN
jgi:mono/diheme cytochrome c family protein